MKNLKKILLGTLSVALLFQVHSGRYLQGVTLNPFSQNNAHFSASVPVNTVTTPHMVNDLDINKYEDKEERVVEDEQVLTREEELLNSGYKIIYENNTETELFLYNEDSNEMKIIQYFEPTLELGEDGLYRPREVEIKRTRSGDLEIEGVVFNRIINEEVPLQYNQNGVEFAHYFEGETLKFKSHKDNTVSYEAESGLVISFIVYESGIITQKQISYGVESSVEVRKILSDHSFEELEDGFVVSSEAGDITLTKLSNEELFNSGDNTSRLSIKGVVDYAYDLDKMTDKLIIKEMYDQQVLKEVETDIELIIEYTSAIPVSTQGVKYLRGTRSNGAGMAYPYGSTPTYLPTGAPNESRYVRSGNRNIDNYDIGENFVSKAFYEDQLDYKSYLDNYHVGKTVIDNGVQREMFPVTVDYATLNVTLPGVGPVGSEISMGDYFRYSGRYEDAKTYTVGGTGNINYSLNVMEGSSFDPMALSHNNYFSWLPSLSTTPATGNVAPGRVSSASMDSGPGTVLKFDITNAIAKWNRTGKVGNQVIRIESDSWDHYLATLDHPTYGGPSVELTVREMPDFAKNDLKLSDTTVKLRAYTSNDQQGALVAQAITIDGLTSYEALVKYEIYDEKTKKVVHSNITTKEARETYAYPYYDHGIVGAQNYYRLESNYQSEELISLKKFENDTVYGVRVKASEKGEESEWIEGDKFQIYKVGYKFETFYRILNFYGRAEEVLIEESKVDNNMINPVISEKNVLFIRNPKKNAGKSYVASDLSDADKKLIDGGLMGMNLKCEYGFEPINFNNGNFFYNIMDGVIFDGQNRVDIYRYYNAKKDGIDSAFGRNWSSIFDAKLQMLNNGSMAFADPTGRVHVMTKNEDESYNTSYGEGYSFERVEVGNYSQERDSDYYIPDLNMEPIRKIVTAPMFQYIVTTDEDVKYYYNDLFQLLKVEQSNGSSMYFEHNYYGISKVITDTSKELILNYNEDGYVKEMVYPSGAISKYEYDKSGNLISYIDPEGAQVDYKYESDINPYLMTSYNMKDDVDLIKNTYDEELRVVKQVDANGTVSKLTYNEDHTIIEDAEGNKQEVYFNGVGYTTKVVNNGKVTEYELDELGNIVNETISGSDTVPLTTKYEYKGNKMSKMINPSGKSTSLKYDENGNVIEIDNGDYVEYKTYDAANNLTSTRSEVAGEVKYEYNEQGYLTKQINAEGGISEKVYDDKMNVVKEISTTGETLYEYDENGLLISKTNEFGGKYTYKRNLRGEIVETVDPYNNSEYFEFDEMGNLTSKQDMNGYLINFKYDAIGNKLEEIKAYGTTKYEYDNVYNLIKETDANGNETLYEYDSQNRLVKTIQPNGNEIITTYDSNGNKIKEEDNLGVLSENFYNDLNSLSKTIDASGKVTEYEYDELNRRIKTIENGIVTNRTEYNHLGQVYKTYNADDVFTEQSYVNGKNVTTTIGEKVSRNEYGLNGMVTKTYDSYDFANVTEYTKDNKIGKSIDADGIVTEYKYDLKGREVEILVGGVTTSRKEYFPNGQIKVEYDGNGNKTEYSYDFEGRQIAKTAADGAVASFKYDSVGNVLEVIDPFGNSMEYEYDKVGNKISDIDPLGRETKYEYDIRSREVKVTYPDGTTSENEYNDANQLIKSTGRDGLVTETEYDDFGRVIKTLDNTNRSIEKVYDHLGRVIEEVNHGDQTTKYKYDMYGNKISQETFDLNVTKYIYDKESRQIETIDPLENSTYTTYTPAGRTLTQVAINGGETKYEYDSLGRNSKTINALGEVLETVYDANGNMSSSIDSKGLVTKYEYDKLNRQVKTINPLGIATSKEFDAAGNLVTEVDGRGNKTSYKYDEVFRQIESVNELGFKTLTEYDVNDNIIKTIDANGIETEFEYDVVGNLTSKLYDTGAKEEVEYDTRYNVVKGIDGNGNAVQYEYDDLDRMVKQISSSGNEFEYEYDARGDLVEERDSLGVIANYEYNKVHNVLVTEDAAGNETIYTYCECGGLVETMQDINGNVITYEYDLLNRITTQTDERGNVTNFTYDANGNTSALVINDSRVFSYEYDSANRLIKDINPLEEELEYKYDENNNKIEEIDGNKNSVFYQYDELNRQTIFTDAEGNETEYQYDGVNKVAEIDANGNSTKYEYDAIGNVVKVENAKEEVTLYEYDYNSNLLYVNVEGRVVQSNKYDASNNLIKNSNAKKMETEYEYDLRNNQTKQESNAGVEVVKKYDELNRMITQLSEDVELKMEYDKTGNLTKAIQNEDVTEVKYNNNNDIVEYKDENGNLVKYEYDQYGNQTSVEYSDGRKVLYEYDSLDRIVKIVDVEGSVTSYKYDANGNRINEQLPNNIEVKTVYNKNNQILNKNYLKQGKVILKLSYEYSPTGQVVRETKEEFSEDESEDDLKTIKLYEYDELEQLTKAEYKTTKGEAKETITYEYKYNVWNDRQEVKITKNGIEQRIKEEVNKAGQIVSREEEDGRTKYDYDEDGNLIKETKEDGSHLTYEYNSLNQLIAIYSSTGYYETYDYDGLGNRIRKETFTPYNVYDTDGFSSKKTLRQELETFIKEEASHKDKENKTQTLREELQEDINCDNIKEDTLIDKEVIEYVNDINTAHARVLEVKGDSYQRNVFDQSHAFKTNEDVNVLDHKGSVVAKYGQDLELIDYTPQGLTLNTKLIQSKNTVDSLGYNNEMHNNFNLQYLRARYYNQETARFISEDTYKGAVGDSITNSLYTYVGNDGVNNTDPSGNMIDDGNGGTYNPWSNTFTSVEGETTTNFVENWSRPVLGGSNYKYKNSAQDAAKEVSDKYGVDVTKPDDMTWEEFYNYVVQLKKYCETLEAIGVNLGGVQVFINQAQDSIVSFDYEDMTAAEIVGFMFGSIFDFEGEGTLRDLIIKAHEKYREDNPHITTNTFDELGESYTYNLETLVGLDGDSLKLALAIFAVGSMPSGCNIAVHNKNERGEECRKYKDAQVKKWLEQGGAAAEFIKEQTSGGTEDLHTILDILGMMPVIGEIFDIVNGIIYAAEGDKVNAALSFMFAIPAGVELTVKAGKYILRNSDGIIKAFGSADEAYAFIKSMDNPSGSGYKNTDDWLLGADGGMYIDSVDDVINGMFESGSKTWAHLGDDAAEFINKNVPTNFQDDVANAFTGNAKVTTLSDDVVVYRYSNGGSNSTSYWVTPNKTSNPVGDLALPPSNSASVIDEFVIPKGTTIMEGTVAPNFGNPGGGTQYYVPDPSVLKPK